MLNYNQMFILDLIELSFASLKIFLSDYYLMSPIYIVKSISHLNFNQTDKSLKNISNIQSLFYYYLYIGYNIFYYNH